MSGSIWVLVYAVAPSDEPDAVLAAYHTISKELAGTPGLLGNRLLQALDGTGRFVVMSEWRDAQAFQRWEQGANHRDTTSPLRPYQDRGRESSFGIYELVASY
ncbi:MAG TPA: antibiotic biosynthesis monooxygenase family protein [Micromonosporaceae bacterium]